MDPFKEKPIDLTKTIEDWQSIYPQSYKKNDVSPYTKTRIILMNGTEFEANWFSHCFSRNNPDNDLRRELALVRHNEKSQQMKIACLKPIDESILEHTISYEQLAVNLTAELAKREPDTNVKEALNFALLEDFDHLYRYSDLLEIEEGIHAESLVGKYTEIMPARPTIAHHRHPFDNIKFHINSKNASPITRLNVAIITAAEQQTMNYYMNVNSLYISDIGRRLYQEIGLVEEEHVTQYGSLMDPNMTWLENLLCHEYTECYLYYSCYVDENDAHIKKIWERFFEYEVAHLHKAAELLKKYEGKEYTEVIPEGTFPELLKIGSNIEYVRELIKKTVNMTGLREGYAQVSELSKNSDFVKFQKVVNHDISTVPSHNVIEKIISKNSSDYRYETAVHPIMELRNNKVDNTKLGRPCKS